MNPLVSTRKFKIVFDESNSWYTVFNPDGTILFKADDPESVSFIVMCQIPDLSKKEIELLNELAGTVKAN
jgi:hypothetical protein